MSAPLVTVLMPVYNAGRFLKQAIQSVLAQTFTDFELLLIDDASTDASVSIIQSFSDGRIRLIRNQQNMGLIATLNKGIAEAKGTYIARMDQDDSCVSTRFEKQIHYLNQHPEVAVVASHILQINANDDALGYWTDDIANITPQQIFAALAKTNCIAHPSVMMRTTIIREYHYHKRQTGSEDWDLWMRMASDGKRIDKIPEVLLKYRIHAASITATYSREMHVEKKINRVRITFLKNRLKKLRFKKFELLVFIAILRTIARDIKVNRLPQWLRFWKRMLTISPIRAYREFLLLKRTVQTKNTGGMFFFFPYTHVGGAEKVHALIAETVKDQQPWIFFTGFSINKKFLPLFHDSGLLLDVTLGINHPFFIKRSMRLIIDAIEQVEHPVIFGCNNMFFYDIIPHLSLKVKVIDLMHDFRFDGEEQVFESYLPVFMRCDQRVFISEQAISQTKKFYAANSIASTYAERLVYIPNYVPIPDQYTEKKTAEPITVLYVGRGTAEKRAHLVLAIAKACLEKKLPVQFQVVGDIDQPSDLKNNPSIFFTGELTDTTTLKSIYKNADILLITSEREGFPMAIMEGMAYGVIPISTPVGDVPKHIHNGETGYVTSSIESQTTITEMVEFIHLLIAQEEQRKKLSRHAFEYAKAHFSEEQFTSAYRKLLMGT